MYQRFDSLLNCIIISIDDLAHSNINFDIILQLNSEILKAIGMVKMISFAVSVLVKLSQVEHMENFHNILFVKQQELVTKINDHYSNMVSSASHSSDNKILLSNKQGNGN